MFMSTGKGHVMSLGWWQKRLNLRSSLGGMLEGIKSAIQGVNENAVKISETTTKYQDTLLQLGPSAAPAAPKLSHLVLLAPRLQARESVRASQVLIDVAVDQGSGMVTLTRESVASLRDWLNRALVDCDQLVVT